MPTFFAADGRDATEDLARKRAILQNSEVFQALIQSVPLPVMVLNDKRQVVAANEPLLNLAGRLEQGIVGKRPGEVIGCARWKEGPDGCGTSRYCLTCGAVEAILASQGCDDRVTRECRIVCESETGPAAMDLRVTARGIELEGERFSVCSVEDVSDRKRLAVLTRMFFHDVLNTAGCIQGYMYLLARGGDGGSNYTERLSDLIAQLVEEIESQRDLTYAESGDLAVQPEAVHTGALLMDLRTLYAGHSVAQGRQIALGDIWDGPLVTEGRLLARVLGNMVKNALEATPVGGTVSLDCLPRQEEVVFRVRNPGVIPENVQLQIFQRSFSTKAPAGRGIGTYSMKLLGERYLRGRVDFVSREPEGTVFSLAIPRLYDRPGEQSPIG